MVGMAPHRDTSSVAILALATAGMAVFLLGGLFARSPIGIGIALVALVALGLGFREARRNRS